MNATDNTSDTAPIREPESRHAVRFQDCDPFGHLNNARYIDYFLNAREDHLARCYDMRIHAHDRRVRENWVVSKHQIAYLSSADVGEEVLIRTRLIRATDYQTVVEGLMFDAEGQRLKSLIWMEFAYVSLRNGRPVRHPDDLSQFLQAILVKATAADFDRRIEALTKRGDDRR